MADALKSVLVTGGSDGLGHAAALLLAEHGYRVFAGGRDRQKLAELGQLARERQLHLQPIELDVCDDESVARAVSEIERSTGAIDVLINNAGILILATMEDISLEDLQKQFETNVFGAVRVSKRVLPAMRARRSGRIINMSSLSGKVAHPLWGPYSSSKHALEAISDAMRLELYPFSIDVVLIEPGYIPTNIKGASAKLSAAYTEAAERSPYAGIYRAFLNSWRRDPKWHDTPDDCARVVLRAVESSSPRARYAVTRFAKRWILARRLLPDRFLDFHLRKVFELNELRRLNEKTTHHSDVTLSWGVRDP